MKKWMNKGGAFKYHYSVQVDSVTLRDGIALSSDVRYRLLWKKGDRAASTREIAANGVGTVEYDESLSLVCTMYRDSTRAGAQFLPKEASFTLLCGREGKPTGSYRPLGRAKVDLARHAGLETTSEALRLVLLHDGVPVGDLHLTLASRWLRNYDKRGADGGSLVSDSGSESGLSSIGSEAESTGWPTPDDDTDADFSDVGSEAGESRAGSSRRLGGGLPRGLSGYTDADGSEAASDAGGDDRELDTEEELEAIEEQQHGLKGAGRMLKNLMPKLHIGGVGKKEAAVRRERSNAAARLSRRVSAPMPGPGA